MWSIFWLLSLSSIQATGCVVDEWQVESEGGQLASVTSNQVSAVSLQVTSAVGGSLVHRLFWLASQAAFCSLREPLSHSLPSSPTQEQPELAHWRLHPSEDLSPTPSGCTRMYSDYSLLDVHQLCIQKAGSVLDQVPGINGPQLVSSLIRPLVSSTSNAAESLQQCLQEDKDVLWFMEVIGYGLSLHFYDQDQVDAIRDCVNLYYEWFHALSPSLAANKFIPLPIRQDPNLYCQKIIGHLYNIFKPRTFTSNDNINDLSSKQAVFCHRILRLIINIATDKDNLMNAATWESLLVFLLGINEELLKSQNHSEGIGTQIAERVISTLFEVCDSYHKLTLRLSLISFPRAGC